MLVVFSPIFVADTKITFVCNFVAPLKDVTVPRTTTRFVQKRSKVALLIHIRFHPRFAISYNHGKCTETIDSNINFRCSRW